MEVGSRDRQNIMSRDIYIKLKGRDTGRKNGGRNRVRIRENKRKVDL
jgi:hypothetical protein